MNTVDSSVNRPGTTAAFASALLHGLASMITLLHRIDAALRVNR